MVIVWKPITDLPDDWTTLTDGELGPLLQFWNDQRADLEQSGVLASFTQRLAREWSIETGQIEGVYDLDRGITETLIDRGLNADLIPTQPGQKLPELIAAIIQDHADALEGLFEFVKGNRPLSKSYIHELHAALLQHQDSTLGLDQFGNLFEARLLKGRYKERPNNPKRPNGTIHQYSPPEQVDSEMEGLLSLHEQHESRDVPVEIEAAWLHHRFAQIHPYQDGNGRVARALASLIFIKRGWFPVVVTRDDRARYIDALEIADNGDLKPLGSFFVELQKLALFNAIQAAADIQPGPTMHNVEEVVAEMKRDLARPRPVHPEWLITTRENTGRLLKITADRLEELARLLSNEFISYKFRTNHSAWAQTSELLSYRPNISAYEQGRQLLISDPQSYTTYIEVNAHAVGSSFHGLIAIVAIFWPGKGPAERASNSIFQANYAEPYESTERRFRAWLEECLVNALTLWRKTL